LKVMAGDQIKARTFFWQGETIDSYNNNTNTDLIALLMNAFTGNLAATSGGKLSSADVASNTGLINSSLLNFLNTQTPQGTEGKIYLSWILLDEQKLQLAASGFVAVDPAVGFDPANGKVLLEVNGGQAIDIPKNGYLYVYVSSEVFKTEIFFDDIRVEHVRGALVEENAYMPFGLVAKGISSNAAGKLENKRKYNSGSELESKEFSDGSGLELYSTFYRSLDPQLGRFWQIDPKPDCAQSLYSSMNNNPISLNDPLGDTVRVSFGTGFLGLGKRKEVIYNNGTLTNSDGSAYTGKIKGYLGKVVNGLQSLRNTAEGNSIVSELQNSKNNFTIRRGSENKFVASESRRSFGNIPEVMATVGVGGTTIAGGSGGTIFWNPSNGTSGMNAAGNIDRPAFIGLGHEMAHARDANDGTLYPSDDYTNTQTGATYQAMQNGLKKSEWRAVYMENIIRMQAGVPLRVNYGLSDNGEVLSGTGPSTVQTISIFGSSLTLPINYTVK
jgi:RHS repeat-associated protein